MSILVGDCVLAKVITKAASGVIVELEGGEHGIIRHRELYWTQSTSKKKIEVEVGDEVKVVILDFNFEKNFGEFSLKRALGDPWKKVIQGEYKENQIVTGEIVEYQEYGVFVEIEPGIVGLLHKSAVPLEPNQKIQEALWIQDQVKVLITKIDQQEKRISLSIVDLLKLRQKEKPPTVNLHRQRSELNQESKGGTHRLNSMNLGNQAADRRIWRILIVDDDRTFTKGFRHWLKRLGYDVDIAGTMQEALSTGLNYDLLFIDINLPDGQGISLAAEKVDPTRIIVISGLTWEAIRITIPEGLQVGAILNKPLDYSEVLTCLDNLEKGTSKLVPVHLSVITERDDDFIRNASNFDEEDQSIHVNAIHNTLDQLRVNTGARAALLFAVDSEILNISVFAASQSETTSITMNLLQSLRYSQVWNVAIGRDEIKENDAIHNKRFETLLRFIDFQSCVAIPIPIKFRYSRYALFLFDPSDQNPLNNSWILAHSAANLIAAFFQVQEARSMIQESHEYILAGQLSVSLVHEIRDKLSIIEQQGRNLELDHQDISEAQVRIAKLIAVDRIDKRVGKILNANNELRELIKQYLGLLGKKNFESMDINTLLNSISEQSVLFKAEKEYERISAKLDEKVPRIHSSTLRLKQIFINIVKNAFQLMGDDGTLLIESCYKSEDIAYPIKIRFSDEGPGIHWKNRDWIFELGTTTRKDGTGIGLFVSKGLIKSLNGRISIENSYMFIGTTFLIELPLNSIKENIDV